MEWNVTYGARFKAHGKSPEKLPGSICSWPRACQVLVNFEMKKKRLERYREGLLQPPRFLFPSIPWPPICFTDLFLPDHAEHPAEHLSI
jgi:hypothetical protein